MVDNNNDKNYNNNYNHDDDKKKNYYFIHRGFCAISTKVQMRITDLKIKGKVHLEQSAMIRKYFLREGMRV